MLTDLFNLRYARKLTIKDLESLSGVSDSSINRIETGNQIPKVDVVCKLARAFNIHPCQLFAVLVDGENY